MSLKAELNEKDCLYFILEGGNSVSTGKTMVGEDVNPFHSCMVLMPFSSPLWNVNVLKF